MTEHLVQPRLQIEQFSRTVEAGHHRLERILLIKEPVFVRTDNLIGGQSKLSSHKEKWEWEWEGRWARTHSTSCQPSSAYQHVFEQRINTA